jgi:CheY-like chemotaxis protein
VKALIVDDEPSVRLLLSRVLRREVDCTVSEATNGIEALDMLGREHFDFVVIDVMMPMMDGLETLEAIRATASLRHLPVMVLSAVRDEARVRQLVALGISAYLTKPLRPSDAAARVRRFVSSVASHPHPAAAGVGRGLAELREQARILVVDGDADFRRFVRDTVGDAYTIVAAEGGAQGLRACLDSRPDAILLGQNLGAVPATMFLRKLRSLPALATVPVVLATPGGTGEPGLDVAAVIPRTFVATVFKQQFARLVSGPAEGQRLVLTRPELRPQMIAATEQVFGMLLGVEVFAEPAEPPAPDAADDLVRIYFTLRAADSDLEFGITMSREMSEHMTAILRQGTELVTDEDVAGALREVATIVGVRIQNALRARGDDVSTATPNVGTVADAEGLSTAWTPVGFHDAAGDVRFTTFLRPLARPAATAPAPLQSRAS